MNQLFELKFGSSLYGTSTPNSDLDLKGIYLPTAREIVLGNYKKTINISRKKKACERNTKDDVDLEIFSLDRYLEALMDGQIFALDILFAPPMSYNSSTMHGEILMGEIYQNRLRLLTKNINAFTGYARQQAARYGIKGSRMDALKSTLECIKSFGEPNQYVRLSNYEDKLRELVKQSSELISLEKEPLIGMVLLKGPKGLIDQPHLKICNRSIPLHATIKYATEILTKMYDGYGARAYKAHLSGGKDFKALSHAVRVNSEALELLTTGRITFPRPDRELLVKIKTEQVPYEEIAELIETGLAKVAEAAETSSLRETPDVEWAQDLVYRVYSEIVKKG